MKGIRFSATVIGLIFLSLIAFAQPPLTAKDIYLKYSKAIVTIETDKGSGTGFFDSSGVCLYTAFHVINGAKYAYAIFPDGTKAPIDYVIGASPKGDYARLLVATDRKFPGPPVGDSNKVVPGEKITVIGSPLGLAQTVTEGIISAKRSANGIHYIQLSAGISPGSSGSPVIDSHGRAIGLVVSYLAKGELLNFAVASSDFKQTIGVPFSRATCDGSGGGSIINAQPGKSLSEPSLMRAGASGYGDLPPVDIQVYVNDSLSYEVFKSEIKDYVRNYLIGSGFPVKGGYSNQERSNSPAGLEALDNLDKAMAAIIVDINGFRNTSTNQIVYNLSVELQRACFIMPGKLYYATVDSQSTVGIYGSYHSGTTVVRESLSSMLEKMIRRYKLANPEIAR